MSIKEFIEINFKIYRIFNGYNLSNIMHFLNDHSFKYKYWLSDHSFE